MERRLAAILAADMVGYSRLMELDEDDTIARQKAYRRDLIDATIADHNGHIVKTTGDGMLIEFASVVGAVECAVAIQTAMAEHEAETPEARRIRYRIGINLGDIVFDDDDIFGDGVNVAARLEALAEPGAICLSDVVYQSVGDKLALSCRDLGSQRVKNITKPIHVWQWTTTEQAPEPAGVPLEQEIRFCTAKDGTQIAYATVGTGPLIVKAPNWMNHLEYDWQSPIWRHLLAGLARDHTLVRFDQRGNGLSDWDVDEISHEAFASDLEAVVEATGIVSVRSGRGMGAVKRISYVEARPHKVLSFCW